MRDIILLIFVFGLIPMVVMRPHVGILLWAWISYMNPHRLTWGLAYDFSFALLIAAATFAGWLFSRERKIPPGDPVTVLIVGLAVWVSITTLFAIAPDAAYEKWDRTIKILALTLLAIMIMGTRERLHALVWVIVISVSYYGVKGGVFTALGGSQNMVFGPAKSFLADNTSLALAVIMVLPLMRYLQIHSSERWIRLALGGGILLSLLSVIGSFSRGALLGVSAMYVVWLIRARKRGLILAVGAVVAVFAFAYTPQKWIDRMASIADYQSDGSAQGRFDAWRFAIEIAKDRPVFGGGFLVQDDEELFFHYVPDAPKVRSFHSIFFEVLGEHSWIGLFLFLTLMIAALLMIRSIKRRSRDRPELQWAFDLAALCEVSIVGYAVTGLFLNLAFFDLYYSILAIVAVTYGLVAKEKEIMVEERPAEAKASLTSLSQPPPPRPATGLTTNRNRVP